MLSRALFFNQIDEMLLRLYYIYEKSPKKCRELEDVIIELKKCIEFDDEGTRPIRASGSRWVTHKLSAMKRVVSKFGAYTNHLTTLSKDSSVKPADRAKLHGYLTRWVDAKYLLGCALFSDLLLPCSIFSRVMQEDDVDVLGAFSCLVRTAKEVDKLSSKGLEHWPTYSAVLKKLMNSDGKTEYQLQTLTHVAQAKAYYCANAEEYCSSVTSCLKSRLAWSDLQLIRDVIFYLETQGWQKLVDEEFSPDNTTPMEPIVRLGKRFQIPLESEGVDIERLPEEFQEMVLHATQFISLSTMGYRGVWWRLFNAPNASEWTNCLILARLLFTLPVSNGKLERIFSTLKVIKVDRRSLLGNETLDDVLLLNSDRVALTDFNPDQSIKPWWNAKNRRPNQNPRREYRKRSATSSSDLDETSSVDSLDTQSVDTGNSLVLDDWDALIFDDNV